MQDIEKIAEKVHDAWMATKKSQGFHARADCPDENSCQKCHKDMVPYADLHDDIKEYDRMTISYVLSAQEAIVDGMSFGMALDAAKQGKRIAREGWKGMFVYFCPKNGNYGPFLSIDTTGLQTDNDAVSRGLVPWLPSQPDILSDDWMVVEP